MRVAIAGAGGMGRAWANTVTASSHSRVVAFIDPLIGSERQPDWIEAFPVKIRTRALTDAEADAFDAVIVTAASPAHQEVIADALQMGCHVLVEKPFVTTLEGANRLVDTARDAGRTLMVSQNYRFLSGSEYLRTTIKEGRFGSPRSVIGRFWCDHPGKPYQHEMLHPMLLEMAIHHLDFVRAVSGAEAVFGQVYEWNSDRSPYRMGGAVEAVYQMDGNGLSFPFLYSGSLISTAPRTPWPGLWRLEFDHGTLVVDRIDGKYAVFQGVEGRYEHLVDFEENVIPALASSFDHFNECIVNNKEPWSSGRDNLNTLKMALGFQG